MSKPRKYPRKGLLAPAVIVIVLAAAIGGFYVYQQHSAPGSCANPLGRAKVLKTQLTAPTTFGGVTEYSLPTPIRNPNAPLVAPDGSVWFAELSVAGLAHFFPNNGTLLEYAWPYGYPSPPSPGGLCGQKTSTWSLVLWDGKVWATDSQGNQLVSMDPSTGQFSSVKVPTNSSFPYTLTLGPDNTLWFTELYGGKIGELSQNGTVREFPVPGGTGAYPAQIVFANSTTGYYSAIFDLNPSDGGVYSFNVDHWAPKLVGGEHLVYPNSLSLGSGALWVALHGSSSVASYNFTTASWSYYPTSYVLWDGSPVTTLPYFVSANGSEVWVNEHYGNRIADISPESGSLVEYSESSQPTNGNTIGNALTIAVGDGRTWFAEQTGNILGYVDASYSPGFYTSIAGNSTVVVPRGANATVDLVVHDTTHQGGLNLTFSDSESYDSVPGNITFSAPSASVSPPAGGESTVAVTVSPLQALKPGTYYAILTATDGLTYESSFLKIVVPS